MKTLGTKGKCELNVNTSSQLRCKQENAEFNICGKCQSCLFTSKLYDSTQWLLRAGEASKRRFLTGILIRCRNVDILENIQNILQVTLGKDFTYTRSRLKPSVPEDMSFWSSDRALDTKLLGMEMVETWDWFSSSAQWTKSNYLLGILSLCNTELLHMLGNLARVLLVREKRTFLQFNAVPEDIEDDTTSIPESHYSFNTDDHPDLDLLIRANSFYEPAEMPYDAQEVSYGANGIGTLQETYASSDPTKANEAKEASWGGTEGLGFESLNLREEGREDSDTDSTCSEDPALMVVPRSSKSLSGVSRYRDFIRGLPVHLAKMILGLLDQATLHNCQRVSQHWQYLTKEIQEELSVKKMIENQAMAMQGSSPNGVSSVYAKIREILVPIREEEKHMHHEDTFSRHRREKGFENVYMGVKTRTVQMEERNVFCGVYNILVLQESEDPFRVAHYGGGQLVAVGAKDRMVRLLDVVTLKEVSPLLQGHAGSIRAVLLCEERGLVISASYDLSIRCWNLKTGCCTMLFRGHLGTINSLDLHGNRLVSGAKDCKVKVWNLLTGKCYEKLKFKHHHPILCVKIDKSLVLSSCGGGLVKMWGMATASLIKFIDAHQGSVRCLFFDQWHILSGSSDGLVMAWSTNCDTKKCLMTYRHPKEVRTLAFLFLRVITGCMDGKIRIFNFLTGDCLRVIKASSHQSPILSLHIHNNNMVVNTRSGLLILHFLKVRWDYSLATEREFCDELQGSPKGLLCTKYPYSYVRAERMAQVGSSNHKIYHRHAKGAEKPTLSHHARSLSAPSMHRAQAAQQDSLRPATWSELRGHSRSRAYIDLQPEFIAKPPSAISPGRPASGRSQDSPSRASQTPRSTTTSSGRELYVTTKWVLTRSEQAVRDRIKKRGPHRPVTPEHVLLKVNTAQPQRSDTASSNMVLNAQVRDAWGSPPPIPTKEPEQCTQRHKPAAPQPTFHGMTKTYTPLITRALDLNLRHSLHSRQVRSAVPPPAVVRPQTGRGLRRRLARQPAERKRPQTSCGVRGPRARRVGAFTTTAQEDARAPQRMLMRLSCKHPGRHVEFEMPGKASVRRSLLDPFRERGAFELRTDTQLEEYVRAQTQQHQAERSGDASDQHRKRAWRMKVKGVPATDYTKVDQVYAPELGHETYI